MSLFEQVYAVVAQVPKGRVISYVAIARMLGRPGAARTVGWAMRACPPDLPWHRVLRADGSIAAGDMQRALLTGENVPFLPDGRVDMNAAAWLR